MKLKSLFDAHTSQEMIERINKLTPMSEAQWGSMSVAQMMAHLQVPLNLAHEKIQIKSNKLISFLFGRKLLRNIVSDERPFEKNLPTFKEAKNLGARLFEPEKKQLIELVKNFQASGPSGITKKPHPFFGDMTTQDWDILQYKHLDHHLRQFGV
jgi:hypothetical protein